MNIKLMLGASVAALSCLSTTAYAQETANPGSEQIEQSEGITEIVVTAQKREESAQKVPIAITAIGSETLTDTGFDNLASLVKLAPSLQLSNFGPIAFVTMRGIGNENTTAGGDPGVAIHFDGIYLGRPVGALFQAFDTDRVEVLRGPQGTLYGRNATGGSINYITSKPTNNLEVTGDVTYGDYDTLRGRAAVNLPISDSLKFRLVGFAERRDGFTTNTDPRGNNANDARNWGVRAHLQFDPSDRVSVLLSSNYVKATGVGSHSELREPFPTGTLAFPGPVVAATLPGEANFRVNGVQLVNDLTPFRESNDTPESQNNYMWVSSLTVNWDLGPVALRSITGFVKTQFDNFDDQDGSSKRLLDLQLVENSEAFSQEVQLLSNTGGPFSYIVGAYYFHEDASRFSNMKGDILDRWAIRNNQPFGFSFGGEVTAESYAFFGQGTYRFGDAFSITGGIRYTNDRKDGTNVGFLFTPPAYSAPVSGQWDNVSYRVVADYQVNPDVLLYASHSTGYKSGGINQAINATVEPAVYDPEKVRAYEVGLKSTLLDRKLRLNISAYHNSYDDLQFQVFGVVGQRAFNASGATVKGFEAELQIAPAPWFKFDASFGYADSRFDNQIITVAAGQNVQIGGNEVQRTPEFTLNLGTTLRHDFASGAQLRLRVDYNLTDSMFYTALNRRGGAADPGGSDYAPGFQNVDARLFFDSPDQRWTGEVFVTNVFDTAQTGNLFRSIGFTDVPGGGGLEMVTYRPPRQIGARIGFRF